MTPYDLLITCMSKAMRDSRRHIYNLQNAGTEVHYAVAEGC